MGIKYLVNESFFTQWKPEMSYILGFFYADGSMENAPYIRGKYIRLTNTDKKIILKIKKKLGSEHKIIETKSSHANGKPIFLLRIGSHKLYDSLSKLGLHPNKSKTMTFPNVPSQYLADFIKGYFDGDGCINLQTAKGKIKKKIIKKLSMIFTSGSKKFLSKMAKVIKVSFKTKHEKVYQSQRAFQLRYSTKDTLILFRSIYKNTQTNLFLMRKLKIFGNYFKLQKAKIDEETVTIFKNHSVKWPRGEVA